MFLPTSRWTPTRAIGLASGLAAFVFLASAGPRAFAMTGPAATAAGMVAMMALWWVTEALPIHWTACVPLVVLPVFRVFSPRWASNLAPAFLPYVDPYIFLFAGGMAIAAAMQQWNLHRRIALNVLAAVGTQPARLILGFLCATAFVSLWISNTATAAMMLPIGLAVLAQLEHGEGGRRLSHYGMALMLAIAYGSNIGGIGTKIGTAPNAQFSGFMERNAVDISFLQFAAIGLPFVLLFLPVAWWFLARLARRDVLHSQVAGDLIVEQRRSLGSLATGERLVLGVFLLTATLWILGRPLTEIVKRSWPSLGSAHVEGGIAVGAALVLLLLRSGGGPVLHPRSLKTVPWETLLLLGGGFAMAAAVQQTGLSKTMAEALAGLRGLPPFAQVLAASLATVAMSAIASNTSTIAVMLVVLSDAVDPAIRTTVLFAATLASSCDFALPAGTPPNAIVFGSGYVSLPRMARLGSLLDLTAAVLVALWCWLAVPWVLGS